MSASDFNVGGVSIPQLSIHVGIGSAIVLFFGGGIYYIFGDQIKKILSKESTVVVKDIIKSKDLQSATQHFLGNLLNEADNPIVKVLTDPAIQIKTTEFINKVLNDLIDNEDTNQTLIKHAKKLLNTLLEDETMIAKTKEFASKILQDEAFLSDVRNIVKQLITHILKNQEMEEQLNTYVSRVLMTTLDQPVNETTIRNKVTQILTSDDIINSVSNSLIAVSNKEEFKTQVATNLVSAVMKAIKDYFPNSISYVL